MIIIYDIDDLESIRCMGNHLLPKTILSLSYRNLMHICTETGNFNIYLFQVATYLYGGTKFHQY